MTDLTITRKLQRWHKLVKALDELQPGLRGDDATFAGKVRALVASETFNKFGTEPVGITRPRDSWVRLCQFCERHLIGCMDIHEQLRPKPVTPQPVVVDPDELAAAKEYIAMSDDEFEAALRPEPETTQGTLF